jgi:hypothetical protein
MRWREVDKRDYQMIRCAEEEKKDHLKIRLGEDREDYPEDQMGRRGKR